MQRRAYLTTVAAGLGLTSVAGCLGSGSNPDAESEPTTPTESTTETETATDTMTTTDAGEDESPTTDTQDESTTPGEASASTGEVTVTASPTPRDEDGTLTISYRPVTFDAFTWEGSGGQFYEANPGERYLVLQFALEASREVDFSFRDIEASVDGEGLGRQAFAGELKVDVVPADETVTGWRAYAIPDDASEVAFEHRPGGFSYATEWVSDESLDLEVEAYDP